MPYLIMYQYALPFIAFLAIPKEQETDQPLSMFVTCGIIIRSNLGWTLPKHQKIANKALSMT